MLIDAHAHLDHYEDSDLDAVLDEIVRHRIFTIAVAMDLLSYERTREIARRCDLVLPTFGVHPWNAAQVAAHLDDLAAPIADSPMLGEIGLDFHWVEDPTTYPAQREVFEVFLAAAQAQGKIVNLHTKGAEREVLTLLRRYDLRRAIVHWYSGPFDVLDDLIAHGALFTVGVEVMRSDRIREIARRIPADQLLTETDNPGGWEWLTGAKGTPALLKDVVHALAEVRGTADETIAQTVQANFVRLIGDDPRLADVRATITRG
jgi:TatD DNase family protein